MDIRKKLFEMQDLKYKEFHARLIPTITPELIIGVRTPELRKFGRELFKSSEGLEFIKDLPHKYYDENNLHAFILENIRDYSDALKETERFLPHIDNWATCDLFLPKAFKKNTDKLLPEIHKWIKSNHTYTVRYAVGLLMRLYLDDKFSEEFPAAVAAVKSDEYYINMMLAWYFATALAKQFDSVIPYLTENRLDTWVRNKTIQKAIESNRISGDTKAYLRTLKIR